MENVFEDNERSTGSIRYSCEGGEVEPGGGGGGGRKKTKNDVTNPLPNIIDSLFTKNLQRRLSYLPEQILSETAVYTLTHCTVLSFRRLQVLRYKRELRLPHFYPFFLLLSRPTTLKASLVDTPGSCSAAKAARVQSSFLAT
mmetsp:Transcript_17653/g.42963  ORF Transcript_17653/g.42963 Transcript_17653/m.42963 type:complete len:142 (+) Transcript_17653:306-731(+)